MNFSSMRELDRRWRRPMALGIVWPSAFVAHLALKKRDWL
jgi:Mg2+ and Co2+ transporter CorA